MASQKRTAVLIKFDDDPELSETEIESTINQKLKLLPSFRLIKWICGNHMDDFINNKITLVLQFDQLNQN